jgi:formate hydrogenlyase subunit 6/NADH:ubiquinone oxidoreductase subunit I
MDVYILKKDDIGTFVEALSPNAKVYAPVRVDRLVTFEPVENAEEIAFDYQNSDVPPKKIVFPQTETMFCYTLGKDQKIEKPKEDGKNIVFGIRPCDAKSFAILDKVFEDDLTDVYYVQKRKNTALIGLSCTKPCVNCFCTSLNGSPGDKKSLDILLTPLGDEYFVEVITEKGNTLIEKSPEVFREVSDAQRKKKEDVIERAESLFKRKISVAGIKEKLDTIFFHELWREMSRECVGCSICTFLCPTCHCFDIHDETTLHDGTRFRVWDTCSSPEYTLHASGYNPRPGRMNRTRNRIYHKYNYYPVNSGVIACVGCGRCINKCPVNIDILDMLTKVKEV